MFEVGPNRCAPLSIDVRGTAWAPYTMIVTPDVGTKALGLFIYANADPTLARTVNDYADVSAYSIPSTNLVIVGYPNGLVSGAPSQLLVLRESYSSSWTGPAGMNGWLNGETGSGFAVSYAPTALVTLGVLFSCAVFALLLVLALLHSRLMDFGTRVRRGWRA
jgi:hypothetical protein